MNERVQKLFLEVQTRGGMKGIKISQFFLLFLCLCMILYIVMFYFIKPYISKQKQAQIDNMHKAEQTYCNIKKDIDLHLQLYSLHNQFCDIKKITKEEVIAICHLIEKKYI